MSCKKYFTRGWWRITFHPWWKITRRCSMRLFPSQVIRLTAQRLKLPSIQPRSSQRITYSNYKSWNTLKFLIDVASSVTVTFVHEAYTVTSMIVKLYREVEWFMCFMLDVWYWRVWQFMIYCPGASLSTCHHSFLESPSFLKRYCLWGILPAAEFTRRTGHSEDENL